MLRTLARRMRIPALAALALGSFALSASAATVTSGKLDWSTTKIFDGGVANVDHTWLGYATSAFPLANGTATPSDGATGDTISPLTPSGTLATWSYPSTGGTYDVSSGTGTVTFDGAVTFFSPAPGGPPNGGHGFTISLTDPRVVLAGDHGQLFAGGVTPAGPPGSPSSPYDSTKPLYDLDLTNADVTLHADGSRTISGIVPSIATAQLAFPPNYAAGAGPDRTPNTFGAFSLRLKTDSAGGSAGPAGPAGPAGRAGAPGRDGKTIRLQTALLRKAPFAGRQSHAITLSKNGDVVASGSVRKRTIRVQLAENRTKALRGVYTLRAGKASQKVRVL